MKYIILTTILLFINGVLGQNLLADEPYRIQTVVIDPGHGGHDPGCLGPNSKEKHIALSVALKLGKKLKEQYPDIKIIYTRQNDKFVELHERAAIANRNNADVFICIHANAAAPAAFGTETFVMGLHKSEANLDLAKRENSAILMEEDYEANYNGFDPNSDEANIIFSLYQNTFLDQSIMLAQNIQDQFQDYAGRHNRGVKQAGLLVLWRTTMPAVLIEAGFITNKTEESYLLSKKGQDQIATSIFRAFKEYKVDIESVNGTLTKEIEETENVSESNSQPVVDEKIVKEEDNTSKDDPSNEVKQDEGEKINAVVETAEKVESKPRVGEIYYTVQIGAIVNPGDTKSYKFQKMDEVQEHKSEEGIRRYTVGKFINISEARTMQQKMRSSGYIDAFVSAYSFGKKVSIQKIPELLKN